MRHSSVTLVAVTLFTCKEDTTICGIVYAQDLTGEPVNKTVWEQYQKQKSRGQEGFGIFNGKYTVKAAMEKRMKRWFDRDKSASNILLFHHRFPTSTENVKKAAHPFHTGSYFGDTRYVLVHNGVISNPGTLRKEHTDLGITYTSVLPNGKFNDSEALLWDFALTMEGKQDNLKAYGGIAFVCMKLVNGEPVSLYFGRNRGRPLNLKRDKSTMLLSSEGEGEEIDESQLYTYNYELNRMTKKHFRIPTFDPEYISSYNSAAANDRAPRYIDHTSRGGQTGFGLALSRELQDDGYYIDDSGYAVYPSGWGDYQIPQRSPRSSKTTHIGEAIKTALQRLDNTEEQNEVNDLLFDYLSSVDGNYEGAYWSVYAELMRLEGLESTSGISDEEKHELKLHDLVMNELINDPDFIDSSSYHPLWTEFEDEDSEQSIALQYSNNYQGA